ncbi:hypothetical protein Tco_0609857, partial [Tanacetum coccineum]
YDDVTPSDTYSVQAPSGGVTSDAGLPSEKVMAFRKNGDDGDLLLFPESN